MQQEFVAERYTALVFLYVVLYGCDIPRPVVNQGIWICVSNGVKSVKAAPVYLMYVLGENLLGEGLTSYLVKQAFMLQRCARGVRRARGVFSVIVYLFV